MFHVYVTKLLKDQEQEMTMKSSIIEKHKKNTFECRPVRISEVSESVMRHRMLKYVNVFWSQQTEGDVT